MNDQFGREITCLRISLTDLCNLRCKYCMPAEGVPKLEHRDILSLEEIGEIAGEAVALGIRKIRITGGEPLLRPGVVSLCGLLSRLPGLEELTLTTNGILLPQMAEELKAAGVNRVNISLDTLDPNKYRQITRGGKLEDVFAGIRAAVTAGLNPIKLNTVLIGGFNDDEIPALVSLTEQYPIEVRFIELMPIGAAASLEAGAYLPVSTVPERVPTLQPLRRSNGVADLYRLPGGAGTVGLIAPLSHSFCHRCDRIRLTSDGHLKLCLHGETEILLRGLHGDALREQLQSAIRQKPARHEILSPADRSCAGRNMNQIGG